MTIARYTIGFILSLILSLASYYYVVLKGDNPWLLVVLGILAIVQMIVQLIFFLHLGEETGTRFKTFSYVAMVVIVLILVVGSLWIMVNLDHNMMNMSPTQKSNYMMTQHDKGF